MQDETEEPTSFFQHCRFQVVSKVVFKLLTFDVRRHASQFIERQPLVRKTVAKSR